jgi:phosphoserine phosphatase RsbU/P
VRAGLDRFVTSAFLRVDREDDKPCVAVSTGGHPLPLLRHPDGRTEEVGREGRLLGVFAEPLLHDTFVELEPGEALVLFTDGVTEARRGGELFGEARLRELVAGYDGPDAAGLVQRILDEVMELQQGFPADDIAIVVVRVP